MSENSENSEDNEFKKSMAVAGVRYYHSGDYGLIRRHPDVGTMEDHYDGKTGQWKKMPPQWSVNYSTDATPVRLGELAAEMAHYRKF